MVKKHYLELIAWSLFALTCIGQVVRILFWIQTKIFWEEKGDILVLFPMFSHYLINTVFAGTIMLAVLLAAVLPRWFKVLAPLPFLTVITLESFMMLHHGGDAPSNFGTLELDNGRVFQLIYDRSGHGLLLLERDEAGHWRNGTSPRFSQLMDGRPGPFSIAPGNTNMLLIKKKDQVIFCADFSVETSTECDLP